VVNKAPIVYETERRKILEEVQPIVYKQVVQPVIIRETKPIYEKIIEAPVIFREVREARFVGHPHHYSTEVPPTVLREEWKQQPGWSTGAFVGKETFRGGSYYGGQPLSTGSTFVSSSMPMQSTKFVEMPTQTKFVESTLPMSSGATSFSGTSYSSNVPLSTSSTFESSLPLQSKFESTKFESSLPLQSNLPLQSSLPLQSKFESSLPSSSSFQSNLPLQSSLPLQSKFESTLPSSSSFQSNLPLQSSLASEVTSMAQPVLTSPTLKGTAENLMSPGKMLAQTTEIYQHHREVPLR
jgi:hypothetical protein